MAKEKKEFLEDEKVGELLRDISAAQVAYAILPVAYWPKGGFFTNIRDNAWLEMSKGEFPRTRKDPRGTHPGYVMAKTGNMALDLYPCSTKNYYGASQKLIPEGEKLEMTGYITDAPNYIVERALVKLPLARRFANPPLFLGIFPEEKLCAASREL